jgi:hypothetical protein
VTESGSVRPPTTAHKADRSSLFLRFVEAWRTHFDLASALSDVSIAQSREGIVRGADQKVRKMIRQFDIFEREAGERNRVAGTSVFRSSR